MSATAVAVLAATFVVFIYAAQHEARGCDPNCFDGPLRTYEPGQPWTAYSASWQWEAQWTLAFLALMAAVVGVFAERSPRLYRLTLPLRVAALFGAAGWLAWALLEPAIPS